MWDICTGLTAMAENLLMMQTLLQKQLEAKRDNQKHLKWLETAVYGEQNNNLQSTWHNLHGKMGPCQPYVCINRENIAFDFTLHFVAADILSGLHATLQTERM